MSDSLAVELKALGASTASGQGAAIDIGTLRTALILTVDVTVVTGTSPTLTVNVQTSGSASGPWRTLETLDEVLNENSVGVVRLLVGDCLQFVRIDWVISGTTPSFTFGLSGVAHVTYANRLDMVSYGMSENVLNSISEDQKLLALVAASAEMSTNLSVSFTLPLTSWGEDIVKHTAILAVYTAVVGNYREGLDETLIDAKDDTMTFMKRIGDGRLRPKTIIDSTPEVEEDSAYISSSASRGWN